MEAYMSAIELIFIDGTRNKLEFINGANKKKEERKKNIEYEEQSKIRVWIKKRKKKSQKENRARFVFSSRTNALTPRKR